MMKHLFTATILFNSIAWSLSCLPPATIFTVPLDDDLVEVKTYYDIESCLATNSCSLSTPDQIDTISHVRMLNELVDKFHNSNYSAIISPGEVSSIEAECPTGKPCLSIPPNYEMSVNIDLILKGDLLNNYTASYQKDIWGGSPSQLPVLFFSDTIPQTIEGFDIQTFYCVSESKYLGEPGRFTVVENIIYQQGQPGLSIPLDSFLKEVGLEGIASNFEIINPKLNFNPNSNYHVVSIEGKILFFGVGSKALDFLNSQPNSKQLRIISVQ